MYSSRLLEIQPEKEKEADMEHGLSNSLLLPLRCHLRS